MEKPPLPNSPKQRYLRICGSLIAMLLPTVVTYLYFHVLKDSPAAIQQGTYSVGKLIQFGFPICWIVFVLRQHLSGVSIAQQAERTSSNWTRRFSLLFGLGMGFIVVAAMFALYSFAFPQDVIENLTSQLAERVRRFGVNSRFDFLLLALFYAFIHSFLEEYYFRWFLFGQLRRVMKFQPAMILGGLSFMGHHVLVLAHYFGGRTPLTIFLSVSIAIGGMIWAYQYEKSKSLLGPWLSHLLVDAGIFAIGFNVLRLAGVFD